MPHEMAEAIEAELVRLGLRAAIPGLAAADLSSGARLLQHLRSLPAGASVRDVFPDLPARWDPDLPSTWTHKYCPLGPWDHQALPTGPAIHVIWGGVDLVDWLGSLGAALLEAGLPFHAAGVPAGIFPEGHAIVVLRAGCPLADLDRTLLWLESRHDVEVAGVARTGEETYAE